LKEQKKTINQKEVYLPIHTPKSEMRKKLGIFEFVVEGGTYSDSEIIVFVYENGNVFIIFHYKYFI
jgi:translation initiation factor RLI1